MTGKSVFILLKTVYTGVIIYSICINALRESEEKRF